MVALNTTLSKHNTKPFVCPILLWNWRLYLLFQTQSYNNSKWWTTLKSFKSEYASKLPFLNNISSIIAPSLSNHYCCIKYVVAYSSNHLSSQSMRSFQKSTKEQNSADLSTRYWLQTFIQITDVCRNAKSVFCTVFCHFSLRIWSTMNVYSVLIKNHLLMLS